MLRSVSTGVVGLTTVIGGIRSQLVGVPGERVAA